MKDGDMKKLLSSAYIYFLNDKDIGESKLNGCTLFALRLSFSVVLSFMNLGKLLFYVLVFTGYLQCLSLLVPVALLNSPNLSPYFSLNLLERN